MKKEFNQNVDDAQKPTKTQASSDCPVTAALFDMVDVFAAEESVVFHRLKSNTAAHQYYLSNAGNWGEDLATDLSDIRDAYDRIGQPSIPFHETLLALWGNSGHVSKSFDLALSGKADCYNFINENFTYDDSILPGFKHDIEIYPIGEVSGRLKTRILGALLINAEIVRIFDKEIAEAKASPPEMVLLFETAKTLQKVNAHLCNIIDVPNIIRRELNSLAPLGKPIKPGILLGRYFTKVKAFNEADEPPKIETAKAEREKVYHEWPVGFPYF